MVANIIVDVVLIGIVIAGAIMGICRGFIKTIATPVKFFASVAIAFALCSVVATSIIQPVIQEPITNQMSEFLVEKCQGLTSENAFENLPTLIKFASTLVGIDVSTIEGATTEEFIVSLVEKLAVPTIHLIAVVFSFIIVYFLARFVLWILIAIINSMFETGALGVLNKTLGCIFSTALAIIISWAVASVFTYVISMPVFADVVWIQEFDGGWIYQFFKMLNPVDLLLSF